MKDIDLYGLGNGLVDLQYQISDEAIREIGLKKGEMRLVENIDQTALLKALEGKSRNTCSGGSGANTIIGFAGFGGKASYTTVLGNDALGKFYKDEFKQMGIDLYAPMWESEPTGTCCVLISPDGERTMNTSLAATAHLAPEHVNEEWIKRSKWLYLEGYKFTHELSTEALFRAAELAKKHETKIAITFSDVFITETFHVQLERAVKMCDLVFCNEAEAQSFTGEKTTNAAFSRLCEMVPNVVVTLGKKGSMIMWNNEVIEIPCYPATPVDSTGAGDMYAAGFFYGLIKLNSAKLAGHLASYASSRVVSQLGARLHENHTEIRDKIIETIK